MGRLNKIYKLGIINYKLAHVNWSSSKLPQSFNATLAPLNLGKIFGTALITLIEAELIFLQKKTFGNFLQVSALFKAAKLKKSPNKPFTIEIKPDNINW